MFKDHTDLWLELRSLANDVAAQDPALSGRGTQLPRQDAEGGGLPRPVGSQEAEYLAGEDGEADLVQRAQTAEVPGQSVDFYGGIGGRLFL